MPAGGDATPDDVLSTYVDHLPSADGHRIVRVRSSAKARRDATRRHVRIAKAITAIDALNSRLAPTTRILGIFSGVARHEPTAPGGTVLRTDDGRAILEAGNDGLQSAVRPSAASLISWVTRSSSPTMVSAGS